MTELSSNFGALNGSTGNQQNQIPLGNNTQSGYLSQFSHDNGMGKIGDINSVTGLINRIATRAFVDNWSYKTPYLRFARELPVDMSKKIVQLAQPKIQRGEEFDPYNGKKLTERRYPENVTMTYGINFTRQYIVSIANELLQRGGDLSFVSNITAQQIANLINEQEIELTEKIEDVINEFIINNRDKLVNIHFKPADPNNPTDAELTTLSAKIDAMNMRMTRWVSSRFSLTDVGYITKYSDLMMDTIPTLPAQFKNKVLPYAFNADSFTINNTNITRTDGRDARTINVMQNMPNGVWGLVRDRNMLTVGQALNNVMPDVTSMPYTLSYNTVHNYWASIFMDVFKRCYLISEDPDTFPDITTVQMSGIEATIDNQLGTAVTSLSLANPVDLSLHVVPTGTISANNKDVGLPDGTRVEISIADKDGNSVIKKATTNVSDMNRLKFQAGLNIGDVITYKVISNYFNPDVKDQTELSTTVSLTVTK